MRPTPFVFAQVSPWDEPAPAQPATHQPRPMSLSDFKDGLHAYNTGQTNDATFRNCILILMAIIGLVALVIHLRQRKRNYVPPDSLSRLGRELGKLIHFPFGSKLILWWVAKFNSIPLASLLLSSSLFDKSVAAWVAAPTFSAARHWGRSRLELLRPVLFLSQVSEFTDVPAAQPSPPTT